MTIKNTFIFLSISIIVLFLSSCEKNKVFPTDKYDCTTPFQDTSSVHPNANEYQSILETHRKNGLVGAVLLVKDKHGLWMGADGKADIASNVDVKPCNRFLIASISKVFTAAAIYRYIDKGILSFDDPINEWIDESITSKIANANEAQIKHLLAHTSGIPDYLSIQAFLDQFNSISNNWSREEALEYVYGGPALNAVGEAYNYSNTNYVLLAMILESASGLSFEQVSQQEVFTPLNLSATFYNRETQTLPDNFVKGYVDLYGNDQYIESDFLYKDDLGVAGDGGVIATVYDVAILFEQLMKGDFISSNSISELTNWFLEDEESENESGFGIAKYNSEHGYAITHNGLAFGFSSEAYYFPEEDMTYVFFTNTAGNEAGYDSQEAIFLETIEVMFE